MKNRDLEFFQLSEHLQIFVLAQQEHNFKTQSKLTLFIKSMFQKHHIGGSYIWK